MYFIVSFPRNSKIALNLSRPSSSGDIDQNDILAILIHNLKTACFKKKKKKKKQFPLRCIHYFQKKC